MVKNGTAKLPLDRVADLARAMECDVNDLMRLALRQFHEEDVVRCIETALRAGSVTPSAVGSTDEDIEELRRLDSDAMALLVQAKLVLEHAALIERRLEEAEAYTRRVYADVVSLSAELQNVVARSRKIVGDARESVLRTVPDAP